MHAALTATPPRPLSERCLRVTVLRGGPSVEREISLITGRAVAAALRRRGHHVYEADIHPHDLSALDQPADVVLPALHGTFGEDGTLQRIMEERGIRFVGSGSRASALAMDKVAAKKRVEALGIDTPAYEVLTAARLTQRKSSLSLPVVVKPPAEGSSVATTIVRRPDAWLPAAQPVVEKYGSALVERLVRGDEITVGIVGEQALPPICVRPQREFYDYQAKYHDDATEYLFEAGHSQTLLERARELSRRVFAAFGCRHLARIDWIADAHGRLWFLEVNTIPGFTSHSLVPKAAERVGIGFDELVERLVFMAAEESA